MTIENFPVDKSLLPTDTEAPTVETVEVDDSKGLSLRDALEVAYLSQEDDNKDVNDNNVKQGQKEKATDSIQQQTQDKQQTQTDQQSDNQRAKTPDSQTRQKDQETSVQTKDQVNQRTLQPPAELNKEELADFLQATPTQQAAVVRVFNSRRHQIEEIRSGRQENATYKNLVERIKPYIESKGIKDSPEVALQKALAVVQQLESGDPRQNAIDYLQAKGIQAPRELLEGLTPEQISNQQINPLREELNQLKNERAEEKKAQTVALLNQHFLNFANEKNSDGSFRYPDLHDSNLGPKLAAEMGSLVNDVTPESKGYIARTYSRVPDLSYQKLLHEAYRYNGGKVIEASTSVASQAKSDPQAQHKHILQARRAAASVPGRSTGTISNGQAGKGKTLREALELAYPQWKDQ